MKKRSLSPPLPPASAASFSSSVAALAAAAATEKRLKLNLLEEKVKRLEEENHLLKSQLRVGKEPVSIDEQAKQEHNVRLELLVSSPSTPDSTIKAALKEYVIKFSDYGTVRSKIVEKHMDQLDRLLAPTQLNKLCMWSMQKEVALQEVKDDMWVALCREIDATSEQKQWFQRYRENAAKQCRELQFTNNACQELRSNLQRKNTAFGTEMAELNTVLTPRQLAIFVLFVTKNHANSAMLSRLWDSELKRVMKAREEAAAQKNNNAV